MDLPRVCLRRVTAPVALLNSYLDPTLAFGDIFGILVVAIYFGLAYAVLRFALGPLRHVGEDLEAI